MATARVPLTNFSNGPITINNGLVPNPQGYFLAAGGSITFTNTSGGTIDITFSPSGVFNNFSLNNNASHTQSAQVQNGGVSYYVNGNLLQPYAIQVGTGPMVVQITTVNNVVTYNPAYSAIPVSGALEMNGDLAYSVLWSGTDPFNPPLTQVRAGMGGNSVHTGIPTVGQYIYNCASTSPSLVSKKGDSPMPPVGNGGGGRIIIRGT
jgi:hypothetical protein